MISQTLPTDTTTGPDTSPPPPPGLDLDLIRRYAIPGPRYTSYPAATQFTPAFSHATAEAAIIADNRPGSGPLSLYFHLPFCESLCWYCGCNNVITRDRASADAYIADLEREIILTVARLDRARPVEQLHFGGGTPTFLTAEQLRRLAKIIRTHFTFTSNAEISVEIDPRQLTQVQVDALAELGMNRASLGVQDTNIEVQAAIHRVQPHALNLAAASMLRAAGVTSLNLDLIYGLPLQTKESLARTIEDVLALKPERLSLFSYAHVPWLKPAQRIFEDRNQLPSSEAKLALFALARERFLDAGYVDIGLDHFARPDDELALAQKAGTLHRNFQGYSTRAGASLYAFGVSSISSTADTYRQNVKTLDAYRGALNAGQLPIERGLALTPEDQRRRTLVMRLMCDRRLDFAALRRATGIDIPSDYARELASLSDLVADGIVELDQDGLRVTGLGAPLLRVVAMRFDAHFAPAAKERRHAMSV
ncbi:MAG: oxygen-independent coproporphyrinogen III oxidase [Opitutaceae bacterium]|jgi:oxygen-independent coproporphyrinogen-3 oxidase